MDLSGLGGLLGIELPWKIGRIEVKHVNKVIDVFIDYEKGSNFHCQSCGELTKVYDSSYKRVRHLNLFDYRCYLNIKTPRLDCKRDGVRVAHIDQWSRKGSHYSIKFESLILRLSREMSMISVARELGEPDTNLWRSFHYLVDKLILDEFDFSNVKRVCVDETAIKKGHHYVTIFTDYDTGTVLYVAEGRKKEVFSLFYGWLWDKRGHPGNIELFSMDMSKSYQAGQRDNFAGSEIVFDRFHIKQGLQKAINTVRKNEVKEVKSLKRTKYIWLKNEENLTSKQKELLDIFLDDGSLKTANAYLLKNGFDELWNVQVLAIEPLFDAWVKKALAINLPPINSFVKSVIKNWDGILNSITTGITNAISEGLNSVMQVARSRARGYRNYTNFSKMIYFLGNPDFHNF